MARAIAKDYVVIKIDVDRMTKGKQVAKRLRGEERGGIPWLAILDDAGKTLATSDGPGGNIGCPAQPAEREHFLAMLRRTATRMTAAEHAAIAKELDAFAEKILAGRKR